MINLDNLAEIKKLDKGHALASVAALHSQCRQAFLETKDLSFSAEFKRVENVVIAGMGGSAYPGRIVKSLYLVNLKKPVELVTGYNLPGYVNENTLVFLSSFSGTTEETLAIGEEARMRGAKIAGITSGGALGQFLIANKYPNYKFTPVHNPSGQPRLGQGYMVTGSLMLLKALDIINFQNSEMEEAIEHLTETDIPLNQKSKLKDNPAKLTAFNFFGRYPILFSGDVFEGVLHAVRNPFNETAKQFSAYFTLPELNHHLMEGFSYPKDNLEKLYIIIFNSNLYSEKIRKRITITEDVLKQNLINYSKYVLKGEGYLSQMFEIIQWGGYVTFYLGMLNGIDPSKIPWVDYFKKKLAENK